MANIGVVGAGSTATDRTCGKKAPAAEKPGKVREKMVNAGLDETLK